MGAFMSDLGFFKSALPQFRKGRSLPCIPTTLQGSDITWEALKHYIKPKLEVADEGLLASNKTHTFVIPISAS